MSAESLVITALTGDTGLTAVVATTNIASDYISQEYGLPGVAITRPETSYLKTIHTQIPREESADVDCTCMASSRAEVNNIADLVVTALATSDFDVVNRAHDFDPDTMTFTAVVTCVVKL